MSAEQNCLLMSFVEEDLFLEITIVGTSLKVIPLARLRGRYYDTTHRLCSHRRAILLKKGAPLSTLIITRLFSLSYDQEERCKVKLFSR